MALLTLDSVGVTPIAPGRDLSMEIEGSEAPPVFVLRADDGDFDCLLELTIRAPKSVGPWTAVLTDRSRLAVEAEWEDGVWSLHVAAPPDEITRKKFAWRSGNSLTVSATGSEPAEVVDWRVYTEDGSYDSLDRSRRRQRWFYGSLVMWAFAVAGAVYGGLGERKKEEILTARDIVAQMIDAVEGDDKEETKAMRKFLRKVLLDRAPTDEALAAAWPDPRKPSERWGPGFKARKRFQSRYTALRDQLIDLGELV